MLNRKILYSAALVMMLVNACGKNKSEDQNKEEGASDTANQPQNGGMQTDKLALTATLNLQVKATNLLDKQSANLSGGKTDVKPGTLAIPSGSGLVGDLELVSSAPQISEFEYQATSIASGPPSLLEIYVTSLAIDCYENDSVPKDKKICDASNPVKRLTLIDNKEGVPLKIDKANVDLSKLVAAVKGKDGQLNFPVAPGSYNRVSLGIKQKAKVKGCVKATFRDYASTTFENADPKYYSGQQLYCTKAAGDFFAETSKTQSITTFRSASEDQAEEMFIKMDYVKFGWWKEALPKADDIVNIDYMVPAGFKITDKETEQLTMVVDMNRLLRFDSNAKLMQEEEQEKSANFAVTKYPPFFFDSLFKSSSFIFVGTPGKVYGYSTKILSCSLNQHNFNANCDGEWASVAGWHTIITGTDGLPILSNFMPDDDNALTVVKGNAMGNVANWLKFDAENSTADINYFLGSSTAFGVIKKFPAKLDETSVGVEFTDPLEFEITDTKAVHYGKQKGFVFFKREL